MAKNVEVKSNLDERWEQANQIEERMNANKWEGRKNRGALKIESGAGTECGSVELDKQA